MYKASFNDSNLATIAFVIIKNEEAYNNIDECLPIYVMEQCYRLKSMDTDDLKKNNKMIQPQMESTNGSIVYPNPVVGNNFTLFMSNNVTQFVHYCICDVSGKSITAGFITQKQQTISIENVVKGAYVMKLANGETVNLVKE